MMVLKRLFISDTRGSPGRQCSSVTNMIVLLIRWSWKGHYLWYWGSLLCIPIFHGSQETELLEWVWWSCKDWFWTIFTLGGFGVLEGTGFQQFPLWMHVIVLKGLILDYWLIWLCQITIYVFVHLRMDTIFYFVITFGFIIAIIQ